MSTMTYATRNGETVRTADGSEITLRPLGGSFGVVITGIDLSSPVSPEVEAVITHTLDVYSLICFPDQDLKPTDQARLVSVFGEIAPRWAGVAPFLDEQPEIAVLSNIVEDGVKVGESNMKGMEWHVDGSGFVWPNKVTTLYGVEVTATGGETYFANGYLAYEMLEPELKRQVDTMTCTFSWVTLQRWLAGAAGSSTPLTSEQAADYPDIRRPLVRTHPVTGRKALWFSIEEVISIDGWDRQQTRNFLEQLLDTIKSTPHVVYRHDWKAGDYVVWDNRCLLHSVSEYNYAGQRRYLQQTNIIDRTDAF